MSRTAAVATGVVLALAVCSGARAEPAACSGASLSGGFGFRLLGTNFRQEVPREYALVGQLAFDGAGALTGSGTQSSRGVIKAVQFIGKYQLAADCSGTASISFPGMPPANLYIVVVDGGRAVNFIIVDDGILESGTATKIAPPDASRTQARSRE
jgi:hypothetical protein